MASRKEIHSTEKLLNLIRTKDSSGNDSKSPSRSIPSSTPGPVIGSVSGHKQVTIGVDIGHTYIKLAKVARLTGKSPALIDYLTISPGWSFTINDPKFLKLLKSSLQQFCSGHSNYTIWSAIPSARVETRCLRIPKLPGKQVANAIYWTFTKTVQFNDTDDLLDFEILGDVSDQGIKKTEALTYKAPKKDVADLKSAFAGIGYPLKGISIAPFAIQNLLRTRIIPQGDQDICSLFVGRDWSRIAIFSKGNLVLSRGIKAGIQSMVNSIDHALSDDQTWSANQSASANPAPTPGAMDAKQLFEIFINGPGQSDADGLKPAEIFQKLQPAVERLIRQVERTFEHFSNTFHREGVGRLFLSGRICANPFIIQYIGRQLGLPIEVLNPFGPDTAFAQNVKIPTDEAEKESYAPAIGLALANNTLTPNTLYSHREKDRDNAVRRLNMRILTGCMICLMVLIGVFSWQERQIDAKRNRVEKLNQQLSVYQPPADKQLVLALFAKVKNKRSVFDQTLQRYRSVAVINELATITPVNIRLLSIELALNPDDGGAKKKNSDTVIIEGLVFTDQNNFEAALTGYLLGVKNSPLFTSPSIQSRQVEYYNQQQVLRFKVGLEVV